MVNLGSYFNYAVPMGKHQLTAVSLFAGVGGFDLALERAGVKVVAAVEIDKNARGVLAKQFPNTKLFNDVTTVTGKDLRDAGFIPEHGIITGGFPCQDLSVAGKRTGLAGARSGLFYEIARIADEIKAKWLVLENVPGLLSSQRGADMGAVVGTLVDLGYGVAWRVLDAQHFGVPQRRRRVFIVAERAGDPTGPAEVLFERTSLRGNPSTSGTPRQGTAGSVGQSVEEPTGSNAYAGINIQAQVGSSTTLKIGDGGGASVMLSSSVAYSVREDAQSDTFSATELTAVNALQAHQPSAQSHHAQTFIVEPANGGKIMNCLPAELYHHGTVVNQDVDSGHLVIEPTLYRHAVAYPIQDGREIEKSQNGIGVGDEGDPAYTIDTTGAQSVATGADVHVISFDTQFGSNANAFENQSPTLKASQQPPSVTAAVVRRLTPTECERLQGFPDGWTSERIDEVWGLDTQADSSRYKQMGNAVAVPCVEWIVNRLVAQDMKTEKT